VLLEIVNLKRFDAGDSSKLPMSLLRKLAGDFAQKIWDNLSDTTLWNQNALNAIKDVNERLEEWDALRVRFYEQYFKGLYMAPADSSLSAIVTNISSFNALSSLGMSFHYQDTTDTGVDTIYSGTEFLIMNQVTNLVQHDYTGTEIESVLGQEVQADGKFFVHGLGGVKTEIHFPDLKSKLNNVAVNHAEVVFQVNNTLFRNDYPQPSYVQLYQMDDEVGEVLISEYNAALGENPLFRRDTLYLDSDTLVVDTDVTPDYRFNITRYVQELVNGEHSDGLYLRAPKLVSRSTLGRTVFENLNGLGTIRLYVTYSPLPGYALPTDE